MEFSYDKSSITQQERICGLDQATTKNSLVPPTTTYLTCHFILTEGCLVSLSWWTGVFVTFLAALLLAVVAAALSDNLLRSTPASQPSKPRGRGEDKADQIREKVGKSQLQKKPSNSCKKTCYSYI